MTRSGRGSFDTGHSERLIPCWERIRGQRAVVCDVDWAVGGGKADEVGRDGS